MKTGYVLNGRYKIKSTLGEGGMANVYLAYDLILKREVAVKLLRLDLRDDPGAVRRFKREAISLTELTHPNIVSIYDMGQENGMQYLVMEYVQGMDLKSYIAQNFPFKYERVIGIMEQILSAVAEAHVHDIIHRDLKPQNILIDNNGQVKITDFGIALVTSEYSLTQTNTLMGSVHYLSPEQARGSAVTKQSDIYSLGIILFEMLTGRVPYQGETAVAIALKHFQSEMPSVRAFDNQIPQALENVVLRATAKQLTDRYMSAAEMAHDLSTALSLVRSNEKKWLPQKNNDEETKILTPLRDQDLKTKHEENEDNRENKKKKWSRKKKWLIMGITFLCLILIMTVTAIGLMLPKNVEIPDLRGMTESEARSTLQDLKVKVGTVEKHYSSKYYYGQIIASKPKEGTSILQNSKVNLVISKGEEKFKFGDYSGQSYNTVRKKLEVKGVTVLREKRHSNTAAKGEILDQSISKKRKVIWNETTVTFTVSSGAKEMILRDLTGYTRKSVQDYADELGLLLKVKNDSASSSSNNSSLIVSQYPAAGTPVQSGQVLEVTMADGNQSSSSKSSSSQSTSSGDKANSFDVSVAVPFDDSRQESDADGNKTNKVEIYLQDKSHHLNDIYETMTITKDTNVTLPFVLDNGAVGKYKIVRDGNVIAERDNITHNGN
ncbi:Stk1 family PASTA domain-containing Ser/Thr kinase [Liquorilactobacillus capillatus]|uniref:non-specific serine/threonine protein kinase n=1 Tax=Liquorilactobacillus capillatus DSM 19910 TaxID=1423731 RepID=A0A0R1M8Z1_9LACO|nr:Stk1 family PASTA domain-containing Ser/Thr kinase [Liquorilactobacillus capillatus]KRL00715.1 serine threonine protein kinase [Liquorilactobacillus capillatus DSM 19910]